MNKFLKNQIWFAPTEIAKLVCGIEEFEFEF